jgi:phosphatidate cytidylyltransferase
MLASRVATAAIGIPLALLIMYAGGAPFVVLILAAALLGLSELYAAVESRGDRPVRALGYVAAAAIILGMQYMPADGRIPFAAFTLGLVTIAALATQIFREESDASSHITNAATTLLGVVYVVWLFGFFILLRNLDAPALKAAVGEGFRGRTGLLFMVLACTWMTDTGAYFIGRFLGKRKLAPAVSPGKTIEGSIGGLAAAVIVGLIVALWLHMPAWKGLVLGALIGVTGQVGDLCKSVMKREVGIKDFGTLLPGHGGVLDRFDSLLVTVFISMCFFTIAGA